MIRSVVKNIFSRESQQQNEEADKKTRILNSSDAESELPIRMFASSAFVLILIAVGIPLWWNTTKVYRAVLPYSKIEQLADRQLRFPILIRIGFLPSVEMSEQFASTVSELLFAELEDLNIHEKLKIDFLVETLPLHSFESVDILHTDVLLVSDYMWTRPGQLYFGSGSSIHVRSSNDSVAVAQLIGAAVQDVSLDVKRLRTIIRRDLKQRESGWELATMTEREQKIRVWESAAFASKHQIDLVLMYPDPGRCSLDVGESILTYMEPFTLALSSITDLSIQSENLFHVPLPPWERHDSILDQKVLDADKLPLLVNPLERYLTSVESSSPVYRMLIYFSSDPLLIVNEESDPILDNSFVVASWGGLTIVNNCTADEKKLAEIIIGQLRILLGLNSELLPRSTKSSHPLTNWEVNRLALISLIENLMKTTTTLKALNKLLGEIQNIVIGQEVSSKIHSSVEYLEGSLSELHEERFMDAVRLASAASKKADEAFFDPSLLALLYFPDDQKYAIYIPLFLPVGLPVLLSLRVILLYYFGASIRSLVDCIMTAVGVYLVIHLFNIYYV